MACFRGSEQIDYQPMVDRRAELLPLSKGHNWTDWQLRESALHTGPINPVLWHRGELLDGRRRLDVAAALGIDWPVLSIDDETTAARHLWLVHPRRAYVRFRPRGWTRRVQLCNLFGCALDEIPTALQVRDRHHARHRKRNTRRQAELGVTHVTPVEVDAVAYARAKQWAKDNGTTITALVRGLVAWASERLDDDY